MIDSAVAGAGPAGLAVSAALDDLQIDHLVLNADGSDRAGVPSAGTRLRLNNPGWMNPMLGPHEPDACPAATEVADRLDLLAASGPSTSWSPWAGCGRNSTGGTSTPATNVVPAAARRPWSGPRWRRRVALGGRGRLGEAF